MAVVFKPKHAHLNLWTDSKADFKKLFRNEHSEKCIQKPVTHLNPRQKKIIIVEQCVFIYSLSSAIDLLNLLIISQEMFNFFWDTICEMHHILSCLNLDFYFGTKPLQNTSTVEILKCICNCVNSAAMNSFVCCWQEQMVICSCKLSDSKRWKSCISVWSLIWPWIVVSNSSW